MISWTWTFFFIYIFRLLLSEGRIASAFSLLVHGMGAQTADAIHTIAFYISESLSLGDIVVVAVFFFGAPHNNIFSSRIVYTCVWCFMIFIVAMTIYINDCCCYNSVCKIDCALPCQLVVLVCNLKLTIFLPRSLLWSRDEGVSSGWRCESVHPTAPLLRLQIKAKGLACCASSFPLNFNMKWNKGSEYFIAQKRREIPDSKR